MTTDEQYQALPAAEAFERLAAMSLPEETLDSVLQAVADLTKSVLPFDVEASVSVPRPTQRSPE